MKWKSMDEVEYYIIEKIFVIFYLSYIGIKDCMFKLELCYWNYVIVLIIIVFDIEFNIVLIFDLLLKVKEVKLLKRVDFVKIFDKMSIEIWMINCIMWWLMVWKSWWKWRGN